MRFLLPVLSLFLVLGCWLGSPTPAQAAAIMGGQLTYLNVGPNQYVVTLHMYRDCSEGTPLPPSMTLNLASSCNGSPAGSFPMPPVPNSLAVGMQYCPAQQQQAQCSPTATLPNYEMQLYRTATITIQPGQWLLSTEICCRPNTANLVGQENFRYEATLNNQITVNGQPVTIQNSSPQYSMQNLPVLFVPALQSATISFNATDPDNTRANPDQDSLVYSLTEPLRSCSAPVPYKPYPLALPMPHPNDPNCLIVPPPNTPATYTAQLPVLVNYNTTGVCPLLQGVTNLFYLNAAAGEFTCFAGRYSRTPPVAGNNKYVVVGRVDDYRRLPGSNHRYLVGSVRREMLVIVQEIYNLAPGLPMADVTGGTGQVTYSGDSLAITVQPCNYTRIHLRFTDPDPQDRLSVTYAGPGTVNDVLQNGAIGSYSLTGNNTPLVVARFQLQPSPAYAGQVLRIPFLVEDDGCPVRNRKLLIVLIRIAPVRYDLAIVAALPPGGSPAPGGPGGATVCVGGSLQLRSSVLRPDSVRSGPQTYTYAWTGPGIVGSASQATATVAPSVDTRYHLSVSPASGFPVGACFDTASFLVRVAPPPAVPSISRQGTLLLSSSATGSQWYLNGQPIAGATGSSYQPTTSGSYTVAATVGTGSVVCTSAASAAVLGTQGALAGTSVQVLPNPTPDGQVQVRLLGYHQATTLTLLDALGRAVYTATIVAPDAAGTRQALDLSALPAGVYALRVSTPGGVDVRRVVRQ
jgi:hypothetical protein